MTRPILEIDHITHHYNDGSQGITDISFSVIPGEFILLAGRNGSGKTTLIRHINGLLRPDKGEVRLNGNDIFIDLSNTRKTVGMVFQDADTQILGETVFDEVAFGPENLKWNREVINDRVKKTLKQMDLYKFRHRHPATLSGGEKRRLTIAGILVMAPEVIIFDEPFANLDYPGSYDLMGIILELNKTGTTIIMATHELDLAAAHAHRILILDQGQISAQGPVPDLGPHLSRYGLKPLNICNRCSQET